MRAGIFLTLLINTVAGRAQPDTTNATYTLSGRFLYSAIWTEKGLLQPFTQNHPWSLQVDFGVLKNSRQAWNYCNCYSQNGLSLGYTNFSNPKKLGQAFTISGFVEPYLLLRRKFQLSLRGSAGLAFVNRLYDSLNNRENIFFSTNMSFALGLGINLSWQLNEKLKLKTSALFNHISNGGRKDPNEGMNFPGFGVGLDYNLNESRPQRRPVEKFSGKPMQFAVHAFVNQRTAWADKNWPDEKAWVVGANLGLIKRLGRLNGIGPGVEAYYDGINDVVRRRSGQLTQATTAAVNIQHYLFFGKLLFGQQLAWFVTPNTGFSKTLFQRYFLEYEVEQNWYAGFTLKAHGDHSDYLAFTTGYFLRR
ncbi:MAG TPA: acyloxyacyl hydrolase [Cyclobacteriaceae bacterium]|nr:acyloxyacyl hydrolase [Cyclobacteriaceae bacterium]